MTYQTLLHQPGKYCYTLTTKCYFKSYVSVEMSDERKKNITGCVLFFVSPFNLFPIFGLISAVMQTKTENRWPWPSLPCLHVPALHGWESHLDGSVENVLQKMYLFLAILAYKSSKIYFEVVSLSRDVRVWVGHLSYCPQAATVTFLNL